MSLRNRGLRLVVGAAVVVWSAPAGAEPPPLSRAGEEQRSARVDSLAEAAARIRLQRPDDGGPVVVTDLNLDDLARRGTLSVAGTGQPDEALPELPDIGPTEEEREAFQQRLEDQELAVAELERALREYEQRVQQARDPSWTYGPENFAPGQVSPEQIVREDVQRELAEEREKLDEIRREGRRTGMLPRAGGGS